MPIPGLAVIVMAVLNFKMRDKKGSTIVLVIILLPVFILILGMIIDIGRAFVLKEELNKACMIAAEEASKCIDIEAAEYSGKNNLSEEYSEVIKYFFHSNYQGNPYSRIKRLENDISGGSGNPKYIEVACEAEIDCFFLKIISIRNIKVHSEANGRLRRIK
jgi:hypothetical protein